MESYGLEEVDGVVAEIQGRVQALLWSLPNVVGLGVGRKTIAGHDTSEPCISVLVSEKVPLSSLSRETRIPNMVELCKTDVVEVGLIRADPPASAVPSELASHRVRPVPGGAGVGRMEGVTGTVATTAVDQDGAGGVPARYYLLGSNLALAGLNQGKVGDPLLQPGPAHGGRHPEDVVARLSKFVPLHFDGSDNHVDAAVAEACFWDVDPRVHWIGHAHGRAARVRIGQRVRKTGCETCYSTGVVRAVNVMLDVAYGSRRARFTKQILTSRCAGGGDGGALAVDLAGQAVGLVLASSASATAVSPIGLVESELGIRLSW
jgi:hypothetical protein